MMELFKEADTQEELDAMIEEAWEKVLSPTATNKETSYDISENAAAFDHLYRVIAGAQHDGG